MDQNTISPQLLEYLDTIYVRKDSCNDRHEKTEKEINEILIAQSTITTKLGFIEKLGGSTLLAAIGSLVAAICSAVFK